MYKKLKKIFQRHWPLHLMVILTIFYLLCQSKCRYEEERGEQKENEDEIEMEVEDNEENEDVDDS